MRRQYELFLLALVMAILISNIYGLIAYAYTQNSQGAPWVDPDVYRELSKSGRVRVLIVLEDLGGILGSRSIYNAYGGAHMVEELMTRAYNSQQAVVSTLKGLGVDVEDRLWLVNAIVANVDSSSMRSILQVPGVKMIVLDRIYRLVEPVEKIQVGGDTALSPLDNTSRRIVQADMLEAMGITGRGVKVAILDTGIQVDHPWLIRDNKSVVVAEYDATRTGVVHICTYRNESNPHGTHVAGIIASQDTTHRGVAPGVDIYNVIVFSPVTQCEGAFGSWIIRGIQWALVGPDNTPNTGDEAQIISMSLGTVYPPWFSYYYYKYDPLITAISRAVSAGVVVVIAAGNDGPGGYTINYLCYAQGVICVGAADTTRGNLSSSSVALFSSRGPLAFDISLPDVSAPGVRIISSVPVNSSAAFSGTSMATPHVSGVVALLKQVYPNWSPIDVKASIVETASPVPISDIYENPNPLEQGGGMVRALDALTNPLRLFFPTGALQGLTQVFVVPPGSSGRASLVISSLANYSLGVSLDSTDLVSYMGSSVIRKTAISFSPQSISLEPGGRVNVLVNISIPSKTPPGTYAGYITASSGSYIVRIPITVVVPASFREDSIGYSLTLSTYIGAGPPEWVTFRLLVSQPIQDLALISSYSEGPLPLVAYMITPSNRFISSVSGITFPERGEYIIVFEVPGYFALFGRAEISISAMKISQGLSQIGSIASNISSLRGDLGVINSSLSQRISILEANMSSIFSGLDVLREGIRNLSMGLASSQQQISILGRNISDLSASLSSLRSSFQDFTGSVERRLSDLGASLSGAIANITALRGDLTRFQQSTNQTISLIQGSIEDLRASINDLSMRLQGTNLNTIIAIILAIGGIAIGTGSIALARRRQ